jgi:hypothetical protein
MAREFRILHHRQSLAGGHWDLTENPIPHRATAATAPQGDSSLCGALADLSAEGWVPIMDLDHAQAQVGETFILLTREVRQ